ncbi:MAG: hypothetical protein WC960_06065 [Bacteroidales bacterium]
MGASYPKVTPVAKISRSHGKLGEIVIQIYPSYRDSLDFKLPLFIYYDGIAVPFFTEYAKVRSKREALIKLEGIDNLELSDEVVGRSLFVDYLSSQEDQYWELEGFELINENGERVGIATQFYDFPNNPCIGVATQEGGEESFIAPLNEELILSIDWDREQLTIALPEGLDKV